MVTKKMCFLKLACFTCVRGHQPQQWKCCKLLIFLSSWFWYRFWTICWLGLIYVSWSDRGFETQEVRLRDVSVISPNTAKFHTSRFHRLYSRQHVYHTCLKLELRRIFNNYSDTQRYIEIFFLRMVRSLKAS